MTSQKTWRISTPHDSIWCSKRSIRFARAIGFEKLEQCQIAIAVSELVANTTKFAGTGTLTLRHTQWPRPGLEVTVEDDGPGIADIDLATTDGYSEGRVLADDKWAHCRRGLGAGLGAVHRLMDAVNIGNKPNGGLIVKATKVLA